MRYVNLGSTGLRVSRLCLGMMSYGDRRSRPWFLDEGKGEPIVRAAIEGGITFFDTADMYSKGVSEEITGRARDDPAVHGSGRGYHLLEPSRARNSGGHPHA